MNTNLNQKCDLVMKGGITSGVVYPKVISTLAQKYQFSSIGGTSAGAIAAAFTAAAEYSRYHKNNNGFEELDQLPEEISKKLLSLFQAAPEHKKLFKNVLKFMNKKKASVVWFGVKNLFRIKRSIKALPNTYFGICTGMTEGEEDKPGLSDWLNYKLESVAGRIGPNGELPEIPLTFGMLDDANITLRTITTNLSRQSPVTLPLSDGTYARQSDLQNLLPKNVVKYFVSQQGDEPRDDGLIEVPHGKYMPVLLAVRLSLSFPILLSALPLYQKDWTLINCPDEQKKPQLCWFSDGGISSNFPVHLFDNLFPTHPTFGISLGEFHRCRQDEDVNGTPGINRVWLPREAGSGIVRPITGIRGIGKFLGSIFTSAQNWQDSVLSVLPGYRERIVNLSLKPDEGGLNLAMPEELIRNLTHIGELAGKEICENFDFQEHRWRRTLSTYSAIEDALELLITQFDPASEAPLGEFLDKCRDGFDFGDKLVTSYQPSSTKKIEELKERLESLHKLAKQWSTTGSLKKSWNMPSPASSLRMFPREYLRKD